MTASRATANPLSLAPRARFHARVRRALAFSSRVYALFCGVILLGATGILFTPVIHRIVQRFHIEDASADK